ncbi:MAG: DUF1571 domain-containing protein [Myxococcaceae bacterium]
MKLLPLLLCVVSSSVLAAPPAPMGEMNPDQLRSWLKSAPKEEIEALLRASTPDQLIAQGQKSVAKLGTYSSTLIKRERIKGELLDDQTIKVLIREDPFGARMDYTDGPGKGRRAAYDSSANAKELRVKEAGLFGIVGGVWVDINSSLTRAESNHPITDLGLSSLLRLMKRDVDAAKAQGATMQQSEQGFDAQNNWCVTFSPSAGAKNLYASKTRVCMDGEQMLPVIVEVHDKQGLLETYRWKNVKAEVVASDAFTAKGAGL